MANEKSAGKKSGALRVVKTDAEKAAALIARQAKFRELAPARVTRAVKAVGMLRNFSGNAYSFNEKQLKEMLGALYTAVDGVQTVLTQKLQGKGKASTGFQFSE